MLIGLDLIITSTFDEPDELISYLKAGLYSEIQNIDPTVVIKIKKIYTKILEGERD